jgi:REP element-mobilizing transposase RayT
MAVSLLFVTPDKELGERLRAKTGRSGLGDLRVTDDFAEAIKTTRQRHCPLALLDTEMEQQGVSITDIGYALRQINPQIQFVVIKGRRGELPTGMDALSPRATLPADFEFSALQGLVSDALPETAPASPGRPAVREAPPERHADEDLPWLQDVNRAAQHLTRLTLESAAQAALITRNHELWAYAGQFPRAAAQELAASIQRHWDREEKTDLLRFVRLSATSAEHMLYATRLTGDLILALVFDSETPFSTIRSQAAKLATSLSSTPADAASASGQRRGPDPDELAELPHLSSVLADVPLPDPTPPVATVPPAHRNAPPAEKIPAGQFSNLFPGAVFSPETSPSLAVSRETEYEIADQNLSVDVETDKVETKPEDGSQFAATRENKAYEPHDARSKSMTEVARRIVLEPASPALYNLDYACLLLPRFDHHYLTGELADRLADWMQNICVAFGWRLEHIAVRPEYLQWVASVPPAISPSYLLRIIRQQTSDRLFVEFPRFHKENPSGDFWAPGYMIMGGGQPHPQQLIKDFIKQTRQRQGLGGHSR